MTSIVKFIEKAKRLSGEYIDLRMGNNNEIEIAISTGYLFSALDCYELLGLISMEDKEHVLSLLPQELKYDVNSSLDEYFPLEEVK